MTYFTGFPTSTTSNSSSSRDHQIQQNNLWRFDYLEDRTAVTYPSVANKIPAEFTAFQLSHVRETSLIKSLPPNIWELLDEVLRDLQVSTQNWRYLDRSLHISSSYPDASQGLIKTILRWSETSTSASLLVEAQIQQIEKLYIFRDSTEVKDVLRDHPFLVQLLLDTYDKIEAHFPDARVFLDVAIDFEDFDSYPETVNNGKELVVSISTHFSPKEAIEALKTFHN